MKKIEWIRTGVLVITVAALLVTAPAVSAQDKKFGGHFGFVVPLVTDVDGETITVDEDFVIGFPTGLSVKISDRVAFDLELVPVIQDTPSQSIELVVHPGAIFSLPNSFAAGVRVAFEIDGDAWGFTPLIARGFPIKGSSASYFVELDFPIRFFDDPVDGSNTTAFGLAFHTGVGF